MLKIENIRRQMKQKGISCLFISSLADLAWLTGYEGTTAYAAILPGRLLFITDSRYEEYSKNLLSDEWELHIANKGYEEFFSKMADSIGKITLQQEASLKLWSIFKDRCEVSIDNDEITLNLRMLKTSEEIRLIKDEYDLAGKAFLSALKEWRYGESELKWAATLEYNMKILGASGPSFQTITASGERGALPHGTASSKIINEDEAVTVDFGSKRIYNSDYTRIIYGGRNSEILKIIDTVKNALEKAICSIKPGMQCSAIDSIARSYIHASGYGIYFTHGLGHGVGTEVHELPVVNARSRITAEEGMVFTVEPGIYIPGKFGVRLEQTVAVTNNSCEILSNMLDQYVYTLN